MIQAKYFPLEEHMKQREKEYLDIIEKDIEKIKLQLNKDIFSSIKIPKTFLSLLYRLSRSFSHHY